MASGPPFHPGARESWSETGQNFTPERGDAERPRGHLGRACMRRPIWQVPPRHGQRASGQDLPSVTLKRATPTRPVRAGAGQGIGFVVYLVPGRGLGIRGCVHSHDLMAQSAIADVTKCKSFLVLFSKKDGFLRHPFNHSRNGNATAPSAPTPASQSSTNHRNCRPRINGSAPPRRPCRGKSNTRSRYRPGSKAAGPRCRPAGRPGSRVALPRPRW